MSAEAFPLCWPAGRTLVPPSQRDASNFRTTAGRAREGLVEELRLLGAANVVISTNVPLRKDGLPYARGFRLDDEAVAVYFTYYGKAMCFACDRWQTLGDNMHAIAKTIEALRGIARWGTGDMLERAFTGFAALPAPKITPWRQTLGLSESATISDAREAWMRLRSQYHRAGDTDRFMAVNAAWECANKDAP